MKPPSLPNLLVAVQGVIPLDGLAPVGGHPLQVVHGVDPRRFD
jgi:hypothetical protein